MFRLMNLALCFALLAWRPLGADDRVPGQRAMIRLDNLLAHLSRLTQWPEANRRETFVVGFVGADPLEGEFAAVWSGATLGGRTALVRRVIPGPDMRHCQVLFIGRSLRGQARHILSMLEGWPVLTIAAFPRFAQMGGVVEILPHSMRRPLCVNTQAARTNGLILHPSLFSVACMAHTEEEWE